MFAPSVVEPLVRCGSLMYGKLSDQANKRITYALTSLMLKEQPCGIA